MSKRIGPRTAVEIVLVIAILALFGVNVYLRLTGHPGFASTKEYPNR